ncbi:hypothetical protein PoB_005927900 [Plakobranchus ocellatus]|uniref:Uncharacterized protein n=1 Tax=Plakobranchus ocellatus TaxID=259542 RepID=A0AAV4CN50_9GAST|nr:hypothetical protein PoB_005927900 [Plakobranchus ocellatus]
MGPDFAQENVTTVYPHSDEQCSVPAMLISIEAKMDEEPVFPDVNPILCRALVYNKKEGSRQCRRRPKRDSEFCHSHDPRYRTNNTARRMRLLAEWRQEQLDAIIARRRREREMEADARRGIVK